MTLVVVDDLAKEGFFAGVFWGFDEQREVFVRAFDELFNLVKLFHVLHGENIVDFGVTGWEVFLLPKKSLSLGEGLIGGNDKL